MLTPTPQFYAALERLSAANHSAFSLLRGYAEQVFQSAGHGVYAALDALRHVLG